MRFVCFFGHRKIYKNDEVRKRLSMIIEEKIHEGYLGFRIGTHGKFDSLVLSVCRELKHKYPDMIIDVVFTTLTILKKDEYGISIADNYKDVNTVIYPIEEEHFKRQIILTNQMMIDESDLIICYVDFNQYHSGAKLAVNYAKKKGKDIINLFREEDRPFYGMTDEEIKSYRENLFKKKN